VSKVVGYGEREQVEYGLFKLLELDESPEPKVED
jgi:hypothetical protein